MKNIFILFIILPCFFHNNLFSQDTLCINNSYAKGELTNKQYTIRIIEEYKIDLDCPLSNRLENLTGNCNTCISKNIISGFTIRGVTKNGKQIVIISPITSSASLGSSQLEGVIFSNKIPFFVFKSINMNNFLAPTGNRITLKFYKNPNEIDEIILSNLLDEKFVTEETFHYKDMKFNLIVENCTKMRN